MFKVKLLFVHKHAKKLELPKNKFVLKIQQGYPIALLYVNFNDNIKSAKIKYSFAYCRFCLQGLVQAGNNKFRIKHNSTVVL
jgi:hypothetical protein